MSLASVLPLHAQESEAQVPLLLEGIWENYNRYVVFDSGYINSNQEAIPQIVLRTFYQWYDDRAGESAEYTAKNPRDSNAATAGSSASAQEVKIRFVSLTDQLFTEEYGIQSVQEDGDVLTAENSVREPGTCRCGLAERGLEETKPIMYRLRLLETNST